MSSFFFLLLFFISFLISRKLSTRSGFISYGRGVEGLAIRAEGVQRMVLGEAYSARPAFLTAIASKQTQDKYAYRFFLLLFLVQAGLPFSRRVARFILVCHFFLPEQKWPTKGSGGLFRVSKLVLRERKFSLRQNAYHYKGAPPTLRKQHAVYGVYSFCSTLSDNLSLK